MHFPSSVTMVLTVLFALAGLVFAAQSVLPGRSWTTRTRDVLHAMMCAAMLAMPWRVGMEPWLLRAQVALFALATAYFLMLLILPRTTEKEISWIPQHEGKCSRIPGFDVLMMASMVVMSATMLSMSTHHTSGVARAGSHSHSMSTMTHNADGSGHMAMPTSVDGWRSDLWWMFAVVLALAATWMAIDALQMRRGRIIDSVPPVRAVSGAAMTAGMALAFVPW